MKIIKALDVQRHGQHNYLRRRIIIIKMIVEDEDCNNSKRYNGEMVSRE